MCLHGSQSHALFDPFCNNYKLRFIAMHTSLMCGTRASCNLRYRAVIALFKNGLCPFDGRTFLPGPRPERNETCRKNGVSKALKSPGRSVVKGCEKTLYF